MISVSSLQARFYPHLKGRWDDEAFRSTLLSYCSGKRVLDLGAGRGAVPQMNFKGIAAMVCGVDPANDIFRNPYLDECRIGTAENIPYSDGSFDVVFCNSVLEHLPDPEKAFREVSRVLVEGGRFCFKTPNLFHYVAMISSATPHWFHELLHRYYGTAAEDVFPTHYRANYGKRLAKLADAAGFVCESLIAIEGRPEYLKLTVPTFLLGVVYERIVNLSERFSGLRCVIIGSLKKRS